MTKMLCGLLAVATLVLGTATTADAQVRFGANLNWASDTDAGLGARLNFGLGDLANSKPVEGLVTFDYYFPGDSFGANATYWDITANAIYRFVERGKGITPYAGGGLLFARTSRDVGTPATSTSDSDIGLNLLGGLRFKTAGTLIPFVELRLEIIGDNSQLVLSGGAFFGRP